MPATGTQRRRRREGGNEIKSLREKNTVSLCWLARPLGLAPLRRRSSQRHAASGEMWGNVFARGINASVVTLPPIPRAEFAVIIVVRFSQDHACDDVAKLFRCSIKIVKSLLLKA